MKTENGGDEIHGVPERLGEILETVWQDLQKPYNSWAPPIKGLSTGFTELDRLTSGLRAGSLTVIGGRVSMGSTSLALSIAQKVALEQCGTVVIFSLDFDGNEAALRILSGESGVDLNRLRTRRLDEDNKARLDVALKRLREAQFFIDDTAIGLSEIREKLRSLIQSGVAPDLVVIDDLQTLAPDMKDAASTETVIREAKGLAQEFGVPVILSTTLLRQIEKRRYKIPQSTDLPSGVITGGADIVMLVYREEYYNPDTPDKGVAEVSLYRNRYGFTGTMSFFFRADCCLFEC